MTIELFIYLFTIGSTFSSLLTQALKKSVKNLASNVVALYSALAVGVLGSILAYSVLDIPFDLTNIICIPLMILCIWIGSMLGYDKVLQTLKQIRS